LGKAADAIRRPVIRPTRRFRGLNPLSGPDAELAAILLRGEFTISGLRNRDIRRLIYPKTRSAEDRRRQSAQISRLLRLFQEHGLIYKIKGTHRYQLTARGRRTLPAFSAARNASTEQLNKLAARKIRAPCANIERLQCGEVCGGVYLSAISAPLREMVFMFCFFVRRCRR
jgi:hypothetical protein